VYDFNNKHVFISGGGTGLGYAIARAFLAANANVIIAGRRLHILEEATTQLEADFDLAPGRVTHKQVDLGCTKQMEQLSIELEKRCGNLDVIVNNCGSWERCLISDMTTDFMDKHISSNLKSVIHGTTMAKQLVAASGCVINMGSFAGVLPMKQASLYSCLKSSVVSLTQSAASELAEQGVRVNCVIPGVIRTPMTSDYIDENFENIVKPIPLGRIGKPEDVANGVLFLCSDQASYITGTTLTISGGKFITQ
jgi:NAD(P)-dependent dehydrogenase (short-subunit alcohol dehydrogenase family)